MKMYIKNIACILLLTCISVVSSVFVPGYEVSHADSSSTKAQTGVQTNAFFTPDHDLYVEVLAAQPYTGKKNPEASIEIEIKVLGNDRTGEPLQTVGRNYDQSGYYQGSLGEVEGAKFVSVEVNDKVYTADIKSSGDFKLLDQVTSSESISKKLQKIQDIEKYKRRIATGLASSYYIDNQKRLWAFGDIPSALTGKIPPLGTGASTVKPKWISSIQAPVQVAANGGYGVALTDSGVIWVWGNGEFTAPTRLAQISDAVQVQISSKGEGMVLKKNGSVYTWTMPAQTSNKVSSVAIKMKQINELAEVQEIRIGSSGIHAALKSDGSVWLWKSEYGNYKQNAPVVVRNLPTILDIETKSDNVLMISNHFNLWTLSSKSGAGYAPGIVNSNTDIVGIYKDTIEILREDGKFYHQVGYPNTLPNLNMKDMIAVNRESNNKRTEHVLGIASDGSLQTWGSNVYGQLGVGQPYPFIDSPKKMTGISQVQLVSSGAYHTLALTKNGNLYGWGKNTSHQINGEAKETYSSPQMLGNYTGVKKVQVGDQFSLLLMKNGQLFGWGDLKHIGLDLNPTTPTLITSIEKSISDINVSRESAVLLTTDGEVYQMGGTLYADSNATLADYMWKVNISKAKAVAAGEMRSYAVLENGTVWAWKNILQKKPYTAAQVPGFANIEQMTAGGINGSDYLLALDQKGDAWAWGDNVARQLGFELPNIMYKATAASRAPLRIFNDHSNGPIGTSDKPKYVSLIGDGEGAIMLTANKEMLFFGYHMPVFQVNQLYKKADKVAVGFGNVFVVENGNLWAYGNNNEYGQLGNGTQALYERAQKIQFK